MMRKTQFLFMVFVPFIAMGQDHTIQFGYDTSYSNGSTDSFRNQYHSEDGGYLDRLKLSFTKSDMTFELTASGIGNRPHQRASIIFKKTGVGSIGLRYSKRDFDFYSPSYEVGMREDQWSHTKLTAFLEYIGWRYVDISLEASQWNREGSISRPVYGLGIPYIIKSQFDDQNSDLRIAVNTKKMPLKLRFEQAFATYERNQTERPGQALIQDDDVLIEIDSPGEDERSSPSSLVSAYYESQRWAMSLKGIWRKDQVDILRHDFTNYALDNGSIGQLGFLHNVNGDSERDAKQLLASFGFKLSSKWTLRLRYSGFAQTTDNDYMELVQLIVQGPAGQTIFESDILDQSEWKKDDSTLDSQIEYHGGSTRIALSWGERKREITHITTEERESVERAGENLQFDLTHRFSKKVRVKLGASIGDYSKFVFRIQPEEVNRFWLRFKMGTDKGWALSMKAAVEDAVNPTEQAELDRAQSQLSINLGYTIKDNYMSASISHQSLSSKIALYDIPYNAINDLSVYDSECLFVTASGSFSMGKHARLNLSASRSEDSGDSMPFRLSQIQSSIEFAGPFNTSHWLTIQSWSYHNDVFQAEDYDMMRFGYKVGWRF